MILPSKVGSQQFVSSKEQHFRSSIESKQASSVPTDTDGLQKATIPFKYILDPILFQIKSDNFGIPSASQDFRPSQTTDKLTIGPHTDSFELAPDSFIGARMIRIPSHTIDATSPSNRTSAKEAMPRRLSRFTNRLQPLFLTGWTFAIRLIFHFHIRIPTQPSSHKWSES